MSSVSLHRRPYDDRFLKRYSKEHLKYEIVMFYNTVAYLSGRVSFASLSIQERRFVANLLIHSHALHLRALIDFLYPGQNLKPTDVIAGDYCSLGVWKKKATKLPRRLEKARGRANKEIAHLTAERIFGSPRRKRWNSRLVAQQIARQLKLFAKAAESQRLHPTVFQLIQGL